MTELRKGQKVRVTFEGEYSHRSDATGLHWILGTQPAAFPDGIGKFDVPADATIEPIEDLRPGDVYRGESGHIFAYYGRSFEFPWFCVTCNEKQLLKPRSELTLLIRNGEVIL